MNATAKPRICAHAGCEGLPLDGLEALEAGIAAGADLVEIDLRYTADGVPVLSHDPLGPRPHAALVTLDQALERLALHPGVGINVDVKELSSLVRYPARLVGVPNAVYCTGMKSWQLPRFRGACPDLDHTVDNLPWWFAWASRGDRVKALTLHRKAGVLALNLSYRLVDQALMEASREAGLPVRVWTVDDPAAMEKMIALGVEVITTNQVARLRSLLS